MRSAIQACTSDAGHADVRHAMRTGAGNFPAYIMAYSVERETPVCDVTSAKRSKCSVCEMVMCFLRCRMVEVGPVGILSD